MNMSDSDFDPPVDLFRPKGSILDLEQKPEYEEWPTEQRYSSSKHCITISDHRNSIRFGVHIPHDWSAQQKEVVQRLLDEMDLPVQVAYDRKQKTLWYEWDRDTWDEFVTELQCWDEYYSWNGVSWDVTEEDVEDKWIDFWYPGESYQFNVCGQPIRVTVQDTDQVSPDQVSPDREEQTASDDVFQEYFRHHSWVKQSDRRSNSNDLFF